MAFKKSKMTDNSIECFGFAGRNTVTVIVVKTLFEPEGVGVTENYIIIITIIIR